MFIFKYINDVLFFMKSNILQVEKDIYELLCNDDLYEFTLDNIHYENYIIYTDNFGINYRVFIHDELLYHDIEFFIETFDYENKLIILAYEKDLPMVILLEDNDFEADQYNNYVFRDVGKETEVVAPESNTIPELNIDTPSHNQIFNYDTVKLSYNMINNVYVDEFNNEYKIYNKDNSKIHEIVRHYKLIQQNNEWYNTDVGKGANKYEINFNDGSKLQYCLLQLSQNPLEYDNEIDPVNWTEEERTHYNEHGFYQKNAFYQDKGYAAHNEHRDEGLTFSRYYTQEELKKKLLNDSLLASYSYANQINKDYAKDEEFINAINDCVINYESKKYMYIRLAPSLDMRISQNERVLKINKIYTDYYDEEFIHRIAQQEQIPIFNDNLLYSDSKYQYIMNHLELPIKGLFYVGYDNPAEDDFNIQLMRSFEDIRILYDWETSPIREDPDGYLYVLIPSKDVENIYPVWDGFVKLHGGEKYQYFAEPNRTWDTRFDNISNKVINGIEYTIFKSKDNLKGRFYGKIQKNV